MKATLTIEGVDLNLLEIQRLALAQALAVIPLHAPVANRVDVHQLDGLLNMLDDWSDKRLERMNSAEVRFRDLRINAAAFDGNTLSRVMTRDQRRAILNKYNDSCDGCTSYLEFRRRAQFDYLLNIIALPWCGMVLCIERDGHTHS